jgi:myosin-light-chain kinase
MLGNYHK